VAAARSTAVAAALCGAVLGPAANDALASLAPLEPPRGVDAAAQESPATLGGLSGEFGADEGRADGGTAGRPSPTAGIRQTNVSTLRRGWGTAADRTTRRRRAPRRAAAAAAASAGALPPPLPGALELVLDEAACVDRLYARLGASEFRAGRRLAVDDTL